MNPGTRGRSGNVEVFRTMKSIAVMSLMILTIICLLSGCSSAQQLPADAQPWIREKKVLIVYLSRTNNTKAIAEFIHQKVGGTLAALELETPYPADYNATVQQVARENETGYLPPLKKSEERKENNYMKALLLGLCLLMATVQGSAAPQKHGGPPARSRTNAEQEIISLSSDKWRWMSERKVDSLAALFHDEAVFVHMGGTMSKTQELDVIRSRGIQYKNVEIQEVSVRFIGTTAILLNKIRLVAVVGGNEVTNPFVVTEVYVQQSGAWKLGSLSFTRLLSP
jgi:Domain of unknown function (DUF4440)